MVNDGLFNLLKPLISQKSIYVTLTLDHKTSHKGDLYIIQKLNK